jgi:hypothetical protein
MPGTRFRAGRKRFLFEKKNQKTFALKDLWLVHRVHQLAEVFASFFKKKHFLASHHAN